MSEIEEGEIVTMHVDLATGGRPLERTMEAFLALPGEGRGWMVDVCHDVGCPTQASEVLSDCTCEILQLVARSLKRPVFKTDKVPEKYQAVASEGGALGWKPPLLDGTEPDYVKKYWVGVLLTMKDKLPDWEKSYWVRRLRGEEIGSDITERGS